MPGAGWAPPAPLVVWLQKPPTLLLCWAGEKVKASLLTADVHMNVRHLPNKYLPKGRLISIPRFPLPSLSAAALRDAGFLLRSVAGPFPAAQTPGLGIHKCPAQEPALAAAPVL